VEFIDREVFVEISNRVQTEKLKEYENEATAIFNKLPEKLAIAAADPTNTNKELYLFELEPLKDYTYNLVLAYEELQGPRKALNYLTGRAKKLVDLLKEHSNLTVYTKMRQRNQLCLVVSWTDKQENK
jgi:hypothetical protein